MRKTLQAKKSRQLLSYKMKFAIFYFHGIIRGMSALRTDFLISALSGCKVLQKPEFQFEGVGIDSRKNLKDKIFFAIKGCRFDGHDFLDSALSQGAKAFVVSDLEKARFLLEHKKIGLLLVQDTVVALTQLARSWRQELELKVIGVTGSSGKTSVCFFSKTLISDLSPFVSPKSYNNALGVSLSLLGVSKKESVLIQEIGTNQPGEIAFLTELCQPDISVVTMVGASHLEGLKSLEGVAQEKKNIYLKSPSALWIFNKDNIWTKSMADGLYRPRREGVFSKRGQTLFSFSSKDTEVDVSLRLLQQEKDYFIVQGHIGAFKSKAKIPLFGKENLENLMAAAAIALAMGIPPQRIWEKLPECRKPKGRQESFVLKEKNLSICFDAYNANPDSMEFFLKHCEQAIPGPRRILVLGDMKELGGESKKYHIRLASHPVLLSSKALFFVGEEASLIAGELKKNQYQGIFEAFKAYNKKLSPLIKKQCQKGDFIGIKASRSLALEQVFFDLTGKNIL